VPAEAGGARQNPSNFWLGVLAPTLLATPAGTTRDSYRCADAMA
jgi:hypothetical protein